MRYILDSSTAVRWVLPEIHSDKARRLRSEYENDLHELLAPDIFPFEVAHALTRAERQKRLQVGQALGEWTVLMATAPSLMSGLPLATRAIGISSQYRVGVYNCLYVSLAEREGCELVTADDTLVRVLGPAFPFIIPLSSL